MEDKEIQKQREHVGAGSRGLNNIQPQEGDEDVKGNDNETDIQIVHLTIGPREYIGEMDMSCYCGDELRLHNAVMVLYQDVGVEGKKVKTLLINLQDKFRYTGEVILYPGEAVMMLIMPLDEKGGLYKDYKRAVSCIIQPKGSNIIPGPGVKPSFPFGN